MGALTMMDLLNQTSEKVRKGLILKATNESTMFRILHFIPCEGMSYHYGEFAKLPGVAFRAVGGNYTADSGIVNPKAETLTILGGSVNTDHQLYNTPVRGSAILGKTKKAALFYDKYVIDGDPAVDPKQFYGLKARIAGAQLLDTGNGGNGQTLITPSLLLINKLLDAVAGKNSEKVLLMNKEGRRQLKQCILNSAGGAGVADVSAGLDNYDGAKIEELDEDGDEAPILPQTETFGTSTDCCSMYCIRPGSDIEGEYVQGLMGMTQGDGATPYPGLGQYASGMSGTQHVDIVEGKFGLAVFHGRAAARLQGIRKL